MRFAPDPLKRPPACRFALARCVPQRASCFAKLCSIALSEGQKRLLRKNSPLGLRPKDDTLAHCSRASIPAHALAKSPSGNDGPVGPITSELTSETMTRQ